MRVRRGDTVEVVSGNDRGKRGRVLRVLPDKDRVVVQGVNLRWKHLRKSQQNPAGGRVQREVPVHVSNVMLYDEAAETRTRVGYRYEDGKKVRFARRTGRPLGGRADEPVPKSKKTAETKKAGEE